MPPICRASSLDQFLTCSAWALPGEVTREDKRLCDEEWGDRSDDAKKWGTMVHFWCQTGKIRHPDRDSRDKVTKAFARREEKLFENRIRINKLKPRSLYPIEGNHEVAMAYNWRLGTSIVLFDDGDEGPWKTGFNSDWITGSCDYHLDRMLGTGSVNDVFWIDDLKTGKWWNKLPQDCAQLKFYALCLSQHAERLPKKGITLTVTHWPKYPAKQPPNRDDFKYIISLDEIKEFEITVQKKCQEVANGLKIYNSSAENCRFCPKRHSCEKRTPWPEGPFDWKSVADVKKRIRLNGQQSAL
jgi:hypothetical protein